MEHLKTNRRQPRHRKRQAKREPYVNHACDECKRRKVRCDGASPCSKCVKYSVSCQYDDPPRIRSSLQRPYLPSTTDSPVEVSCVLENDSHKIEAVKPSEKVGQTPIRVMDNGESDSPEFCGPSSSEFALNMVKRNLKAMGIQATILDRSTSEAAPAPSISTKLAQYGPFMTLLAMGPLWDIKREEAMKIIEDWFAGMGSLYPLVDRGQILKTATNVFDAMDQARLSGTKSLGTLVESLFTDDTNKLKLILAIGRTSDRGGCDDQGQKLIQGTSKAIQGLFWSANTITNIQLLVLTALYHYHLDDEVRTGRIIGFAARLCLEMGLHRRIMINKFPTAQERVEGLRTFWCVYTLERRTSLGQGVPFSIVDSHIDPSLFEMAGIEPVTKALIEWTKLAGKTWHALNRNGEKEAGVNTDELEWLNHQITQWYNHLPDSLKLPPTESGENIQYKHAVLFLRRSHLYNLIHRPVLQSATRIAQHQQHAQAATTIAKEAIQMLANLNERTSIIQQQPVFFKHLLLAAFGNLLLAAVNASTTFCDIVKVEFDMALDMIRTLSSRSSLLMSLWERLQELGGLRAQLSSYSARETVVGTSETRWDDSSEALIFDELFPSAPLAAGQSASDTEQWDDDVLGSHLAGLFEFPDISSMGFEGAFAASTWY